MEDACIKICCNCKHYDGVHGCKGNAPCTFWDIGMVMWDDFCSRFEAMNTDSKGAYSMIFYVNVITDNSAYTYVAESEEKAEQYADEIREKCKNVTITHDQEDTISMRS